MSDLKPSELTAEERTMLDLFVLLAAKERHDEEALPIDFFQTCLARLESFIRARRALFAAPEPAATEMPEAVKRAIRALFFEERDSEANALENFWRDHIAQPVTGGGGLTKEMDCVLMFAESHGGCSLLHRDFDRAGLGRATVIARRQLAAQPVTPPLAMSEPVSPALYAKAMRQVRSLNDCGKHDAATIIELLLARAQATAPKGVKP